MMYVILIIDVNSSSHEFHTSTEIIPVPLLTLLPQGEEKIFYNQVIHYSNAPIIF